MNIILWFLQAFLAFTFIYSGICKLLLSIQKLVAMGQTGIQGLPIWFVRFIGIAEVLGAVGLILPKLLAVYPILTPVSAVCLAFIMPFAAIIHYKRAVQYNLQKEIKNVTVNAVIFFLCLAVAYFRWQ